MTKSKATASIIFLGVLVLKNIRFVLLESAASYDARVSMEEANLPLAHLKAVVICQPL